MIGNDMEKTTINTACNVQQLSISFGAELLWENISFNLAYANSSGLIGRNGLGKSVLMQVLSQQYSHEWHVQGQVNWQCPHHYLPQVQRLNVMTVAQALGITPLYQAFQRIEQGLAEDADFELLADKWALPAMWQQQLEEWALPVDLDAHVENLSMGQQTKLALCRFFLQPDAYLLLDEPSNHLDQASRQKLIQAMNAHPAGCLIISHDREILEQVSSVYELSEHGLKMYGGSYSVYAEQAQLEKDALVQKVTKQTQEIKQKQKQQVLELQKSQKRQQTGKKLRASGSQAPILLDMKKERAGQSLGRLSNQQQRQMEADEQNLQQNLQQLETITPQKFEFELASLKTGEILRLKDIKLAYGNKVAIDLFISSGNKIHLKGSNGSGKSTLLKTIHGELMPLGGEMSKAGKSIYLDQNFSFLNLDQDAVSNLQAFNSSINATEWRTLLGQLRLRRDKGIMPLKYLSGGERLKIALLGLSKHSEAIDLLLLDEPENHLDIDSRKLLAAAIANFNGAVILVSHDAYFAKYCGINEVFNLHD